MLISLIWPFTDAVNVFIDEVYAEIITSLASCEDVNVFIDAVYAEIITSLASCEPLNVSNEVILWLWVTNVLATLELNWPVTLATDSDNADIDAELEVNDDEIEPLYVVNPVVDVTSTWTEPETIWSPPPALKILSSVPDAPAFQWSLVTSQSKEPDVVEPPVASLTTKPPSLVPAAFNCKILSAKLIVVESTWVCVPWTYKLPLIVWSPLKVTLTPLAVNAVLNDAV